MIRIAFTTVVLILLCQTLVFAQDGDYFITKKNDTVVCKLQETFFSGKRLKYTTPKSTGIQTVNLDTVFEYSMDNTVYTRRLLPGDSKLTFVMWLERGKIDLYEFFERKGQFYTLNYYAAKDTSKLVEVKTNDIWGSHKKRVLGLTDLLADAPEIIGAFKPEVSYSFETIQNIVKDYNSFMAPAKDHFITDRNQTISCKIVRLLADSANRNRFSYRLTETGNFIHLNLDSVKEYTFKDSLYIKLKLPADTASRFAYRTMLGKLNLFEYNSATEGKTLIAVKGEGTPVVVASKKGTKSSREAKTKAFRDLIADLPELLDQFNASADKGPELVELTAKTYNKLKK